MKSRDEIVVLARRSLALSASADSELVPYEGRGSDRAYFRFCWNGGHSAILVDYKPGRIENTFYADIASFLDSLGVPVPKIIVNDPQNCFIIIKDLGDLDLWCLRNECWEFRKILYEKTLAIVNRLHSFPQQRFPSDRVRLTEAFGPELYRWERGYFKDNFVGAFCGIRLESLFESELERELSALAEALEAGRRSLVHRDLQSQNVMISGGEPFLIDFQGMRFGSRFYDLGSLLCDPYVSFSAEERLELLAYYHRISQDDLDWDSYQRAFWQASAQRLMQALGAYGFLGMTRGLKNYLAHIPSGLSNLRVAADSASTLPLLHELVVECEKRIQARQ
jgi:N-acetylmuramate 1-kinase